MSDILHLLSPFDVTLVANFVLDHRFNKGGTHAPDYVVGKLTKYPRFRAAMRDGFTLGRYYAYAGTGKRSKTIMGSFVFSKAARSALLAA